MELNIPERLMILDILSTISGNFATLKIVRDLQDNISFSEKETADNSITTNDDGFHWKGNGIKEIDFGKRGMEIVVNVLKKLDAEEKLTQNYYTIYEKFIDEVN